MKNEEYYKQLIGVLLAVLNIVAFFIIAVSTAGYTLIKKITTSIHIYFL